MDNQPPIDRSELLALTAEIVAAHVGNNAVAGADVGALIQSVFDTLSGLATDEPAAPAELTPAVPIKRSVTDDHIVCLEDGKKLKMLKRHLMTDHGMTPEAVPREVGPQARLSDGGAELLRAAPGAREEDRPRPQAAPPPPAPEPEAEAPAQEGGRLTNRAPSHRSGAASATSFASDAAPTARPPTTLIATTATGAATACFATPWTRA